jgi:ribosomal protein L11 methyltransferase
VSLTELEIETAAAHAETVERRLFELGAVSVEFGDAGDEPLFEPPPGAHPLWTVVRVKALFTDGLRAEIAAAALAEDETSIRVTAIADQDWVRAGLAGLTRIHSGGDLWIVPSWEPLPDVDRGVFVHLDPGLAFGTGSHPTTALCLAALAENPPSGLRVLDYGCGSGILAIAALKLGATYAMGVDIDPQALQATRSNAERNGIVADVLDTALPGVKPTPGAFDLILANILAAPLVALAPTLARSARSGGRLLLAGLLNWQAAEVMAAYRDDFDIGIGAERDGWVLLEGRRR